MQTQPETKYIVMAGWDDVPHLDEAMKSRLIAGYSPHQVKARTKGFPSLGSGAVYPIDEEEWTIEPIALPNHWPRVAALDVGWRKTAALWGAWDRDDDVIYLYSEHYRGEAEPPIHASAIRARGAWINVIIDTAAHGRGQADGRKLYRLYADEGLNLKNAEKSLEAGILEVWTRISTGRLKAFKTLANLFAEYRLYQRDENGKIKRDRADHLMDCMRYLCMGRRYAECPPQGPGFDFDMPHAVGDIGAGY